MHFRSSGTTPGVWPDCILDSCAWLHASWPNNTDRHGCWNPWRSPPNRTLGAGEFWTPHWENAAVTLGFMLSGFVVWGVAGYWVTRASRDIKAGVAAGCWSAMVSVLMAVTFGLVLITFSFPPTGYVSTWNEFRQGGWTDSRAFALANSFESVFSHLTAGPVAGAIFGFFGAAVARIISGACSNPKA